MLKVGTKAPDFAAKLDDGSDFRLSAHLGKPLVLYFYPKDETAGCTAQACSFRDGYGAVRALGASIYGVSADSIESHEQFREHHSLPFSLISDPDKSVHRLYEAIALLGLMTARVTYVIDAAGIIRHAFRSEIRMGSHLSETLEALRHLNSESSGASV